MGGAANGGPIAVAVGILTDDDDRVLIQRRDDGPFAGSWEFPGGKIDRGETAREALARELGEELGVVVDDAIPLIRLRHRYASREVTLDTWCVTAFRHTPRGAEGQLIRWVKKDALPGQRMLPANRPITVALGLPERYLITPAVGDKSEFVATLKRSLLTGIRLVCLRTPGLEPQRMRSLARSVLECCDRADAGLLIHGEAQVAVPIMEAIGAAGVHLPARSLAKISERPVPGARLFAASVHDERELAMAERLGADFVVVGTVLPSASHPGGATLGFDRFAELVESSNVPVYGIGGLGPTHIEACRNAGAQGIAAISALWR